MNIAYCSMLLPEEKNIVERTKGHSGVSLHKFTKAIIQGLEENLGQPVKLFNIINVSNYPAFPDILFQTEQWQHLEASSDWHIGYINLFGIKYITQTFNLYRKLSAWVREKKDKKYLICVHHTFLPTMLAAFFLKKRHGTRIKLCFITGDMTGHTSGLSPFREGKLKKSMRLLVDMAVEKLALSFDCFVFATKDMAEGFGVCDKPFVVVECAYQENPGCEGMENNETAFCDNEKSIFYAGSLRKEYGIEHLLRAFSKIQDPNYRLWIAGNGSAVPAIQEYAAKDFRIEFLGFITPQEVSRRQNAATVLVSPRTSEHTYVKYSFPSKTMECLASGKPYIAHRLPCDPPEYGEYIQYAADETDDALRDKIVEICELPAEERDRIGRQAREFVLREKNPTVMCRRIVDMWKNIFNKAEGGDMMR